MVFEKTRNSKIKNQNRKLELLLLRMCQFIATDCSHKSCFCCSVFHTIKFDDEKITNDFAKNQQTQWHITSIQPWQEEGEGMRVITGSHLGYSRVLTNSRENYSNKWLKKGDVVTGTAPPPYIWIEGGSSKKKN